MASGDGNETETARWYTGEYDDGSLKKTEKGEESCHKGSDIMAQRSLDNENTVYLKIYPNMRTNKTMEKSLLQCLHGHCDLEMCSSESFTNILVLRLQGRYKDELELMKTPIENCPKQSVLLVIIHPEHSDGNPSKEDLPEIAHPEGYILGTYHLFSNNNMVETPKNDIVLSRLCTDLANRVGRKGKRSLRNEDTVYLKIYPHMRTNETMETSLLQCLHGHCDLEICSSESYTNILVLRIQGRYKDEIELMKTPIENCPKESVLLVIIHPEHSDGNPSKEDLPGIVGTQLHEYILGTYHLISKDNTVQNPKNHIVLSSLCTDLANRVNRKRNEVAADPETQEQSICTIQ